MEIKGLSLTKLHTEEDFAFHRQVVARINNKSDIDLTAKSGDYEAALAAYDVALGLQIESGHTRNIKKADKRRDNAYRVLKNCINTCLKHFKPEIAEQARLLDIIMRSYGNVTRMSYIKQSGALHNLIQDFSSTTNMPMITAIGAAEWLAELKAAEEAFTALFNQRNTETSTIEAGSVRTARKATDTAYRTFIKAFNALLILKSNPDIEACATEINGLIDYMKNVLAARHGRAIKKAEKDKTPADDDDQGIDI